MYFNSWDISNGKHLSKLNLSGYLEYEVDSRTEEYLLINDMVIFCFSTQRYPRDGEGALTVGPTSNHFYLFSIDFSGNIFYTNNSTQDYSPQTSTCENNIENYKSIVFDRPIYFDDYYTYEPNETRKSLITDIYYVDNNNLRQQYLISNTIALGFSYELELIALSNLGKYLIYRLTEYIFDEGNYRYTFSGTTIGIVNSYERTREDFKFTEMNLNVYDSLLWKDDDNMVVSYSSLNELKFYNSDEFTNYENINHNYSIINGKWVGEVPKFLGLKNGLYYIFDSLGNEVELQTNYIEDPVWSEDAKYIIQSGDNVHLIYDTNSGKLIQEFTIENSVAKISPNSNYIAFTINNEIHIFDIVTKELLQVLTLELPENFLLKIIVFSTIYLISIFGIKRYRKRGSKKS
ncbi:MAG: hypothetical protein OEY49_13735 [Candidatus Heimdallarchaeota archaeon]|nr:hypothetical protein [Candidatus Heimdallarchaeota archaeon]